MNALRHLVSGKRNRYKDGEFDLDLSYITSRVVAMAYPSTGLEATYRNHITDVARFLNSRHGENYMVFNLSERPYDNSHFGHRVVDIGWPDHKAPPVTITWTLCRTIDAWLEAAPENIAVVHCLAGKGRTGVVVCCYLLFSGYPFKSHIQQAAKAHTLALAEAAAGMSSEALKGASRAVFGPALGQMSLAALQQQQQQGQQQGQRRLLTDAAEGGSAQSHSDGTFVTGSAASAAAAAVIDMAEDDDDEAEEEEESCSGAAFFTGFAEEAGSAAADAAAVARAASLDSSSESLPHRAEEGAAAAPVRSASTGSIHANLTVRRSSGPSAVPAGTSTSPAHAASAPLSLAESLKLLDAARARSATGGNAVPAAAGVAASSSSSHPHSSPSSSAVALGSSSLSQQPLRAIPTQLQQQLQAHSSSSDSNPSRMKSFSSKFASAFGSIGIASSSSSSSSSSSGFLSSPGPASSALAAGTGGGNFIEESPLRRGKPMPSASVPEMSAPAPPGAGPVRVEVPLGPSVLTATAKSLASAAKAAAAQPDTVQAPTGPPLMAGAAAGSVSSVAGGAGIASAGASAAGTGVATSSVSCAAAAPSSALKHWAGLPSNYLLPPLFSLPPPAEMVREVMGLFRTRRGEGVKYPSQERTIRYFARLVHDAIIAEHQAMLEERERERESSGVATAGGASAGGAAASSSSSSSSATSSGTGSSSSVGPAERRRAGSDTLSASELASNSGAGVDPGVARLQKALEALMQAGEMSKSVEVLVDAASNLRKLKTLPLPRRIPIMLRKIVLNNVPKAVPGGFHPIFQISTAPYQGAQTRVLFHSLWPNNTGSPFYSKINEDVGILTVNAELQGDILFTCMNSPSSSGGGGAGGAGGGGRWGGEDGREGSGGAPVPSSSSTSSAVELFRFSLNTAFMVYEGAPGMFRLRKAEVDMEHRSKVQGYYPEEFFIDLIYQRLGPGGVPMGPGGEGAEEGGEEEAGAWAPDAQAASSPSSSSSSSGSRNRGSSSAGGAGAAAAGVYGPQRLRKGSNLTGTAAGMGAMIALGMSGAGAEQTNVGVISRTAVLERTWGAAKRSSPPAPAAGAAATPASAAGASSSTRSSSPADEKVEGHLSTFLSSASSAPSEEGEAAGERSPAAEGTAVSPVSQPPPPPKQKKRAAAAAATAVGASSSSAAEEREAESQAVSAAAPPPAAAGGPKRMAFDGPADAGAAEDARGPASVPDLE